MKRTILFTILISIILISGAGCEKKESVCKTPYFEYKTGECCLDSNDNKICDNDKSVATEKQSEVVEETKEAIETPVGEPKADFKIFGAYTYWDGSLKGIILDSITYEIENKGRELKDINFDIELYQDDEIVTKRNSGVIEDKIGSNKNIMGYKFMKTWAMHPKVIGQADVMLKLKFYLKEGEKIIAKKEYPLTYVIKGDQYEVKDLAFNKVEYENTPQRFSADNVEFVITKRLENSFVYRIENKGTTVIKNLVLDLYCLEEGRIFYFVDYPGYLDESYYFQTKKEFGYKNIPTELNYGDIVTTELPIPYYCSQRTILLRQEKESRVYLRAY